MVRFCHAAKCPGRGFYSLKALDSSIVRLSIVFSVNTTVFLIILDHPLGAFQLNQFG